MTDLFTTQNLIALLTLTALEIVLGIDNVIFIAILSSKLPREQQARTRQIGIALAVGSRILLLLGISFIIRLTQPLFSISDNEISGRDLILLLGGLFLIAKSTYEIHEKLEMTEHEHHSSEKVVSTVGAVLTQIVLVDVVFSLDSVITAVGITQTTLVIIIAIVVAAAIMVFFANTIADFIERHPSLKILALSFLILIGAILVVEGWAHEQAEDLHLKNYVYFAMAFSVLVDILQLRLKQVSPEPVHLHNQPKLPENAS